MLNSLKKLVFVFFLTIVTSLSFSQKIVLRGTVIRKDVCEFLDSSGYKIIKSHPVYGIYSRLSDDEFVLRGDKVTKRYILSDKKVDGDGDDIVIHYYASLNKELFVLGARNCGENIQVAIFPMDGSIKFVQYTIKLFNNKKNGK